MKSPAKKSIQIFIIASDFYGGVPSGVIFKGKAYIDKSGKTYMK